MGFVEGSSSSEVSIRRNYDGGCSVLEFAVCAFATSVAVRDPLALAFWEEIYETRVSIWDSSEILR